MILSTPSKSCDLNPFPTGLLKWILPSTIEIITGIINISLSDGIFSKSLKEALVKPLIKKANRDLLDWKYRLVSNLGYASKLTEPATAIQFVDHMESLGLMENHQSAYHALLSTETTLPKVKTDVIKALENQEVACLILWIFL